MKFCKYGRYNGYLLKLRKRDLQTSRSLLQNSSLRPKQAQMPEFHWERPMGSPTALLPCLNGSPSAVQAYPPTNPTAGAGAFASVSTLPDFSVSTSLVVFFSSSCCSCLAKRGLDSSWLSSLFKSWSAEAIGSGLSLEIDFTERERERVWERERGVDFVLKP